MQKDYRLYVIHILPNLRTLDFNRVTEKVGDSPSSQRSLPLCLRGARGRPKALQIKIRRKSQEEEEGRKYIRARRRLRKAATASAAHDKDRCRRDQGSNPRAAFAGTRMRCLLESNSRG